MAVELVTSPGGKALAGEFNKFTKPEKIEEWEFFWEVEAERLALH